MPPNQALPRIRGETVIRVTKDFGELIKQAAYTEPLKKFDYLRDEIIVSDAHNSLIAYIRNINHKSLTSDDRNRTDGLIKCSPLLFRLYGEELYDTSNLQKKWKMILLNCTSVDGVLLSVSTGSSENSRRAETETITQDETPVESETPAQTVPPFENNSTATNETPVVRQNTERVEEYEVVPTNHSHEAGFSKCEPFDPIANENVMRKNLFHFCSELDRCIGSKLPRDLVGSSPPVLADPKSRRWFFDPDRSYDDSEPPAKKVKTDKKSDETEPAIEPQLEETPEEIPDSERCIICLEKRRTHAFLHYGLSDKEVTSHFVACESCAFSCRWAHRGCPMCRRPCINVLRILR